MPSSCLLSNIVSQLTGLMVYGMILKKIAILEIMEYGDSISTS